MAFEAEVARLSDVLASGRLSVESSAEALLKDVDGLSRRKDKLSKSALQKELEEVKTQAAPLQQKTLRVKSEATKNEKELHRIALEADSMLGTSCVDESERIFAKKPWRDGVSAG